MVKGLDLFRAHFRAFSDRYALIGGTACDLALTEAGLLPKAPEHVVEDLLSVRRTQAQHMIGKEHLGHLLRPILAEVEILEAALEEYRNE